MDFRDLIKARYSVRKFDPRPVEPTLVEQVLEAGRLAPTAVNYQPQRVLVLDTAEDMAKLAGCTKYTFHAPMALVVCYDKTVSWHRSYDGHDMGEVDASIVATHLMLAIHDVGLGATWVGYFDPEALRQSFRLPESIVPVAIFPMGYPAADARPAGHHDKRLDLTQTTVRHSF
ncbi:MAG: nitroreductase family protein [Desulfovibrio sp.]|jgi:nitroreductase|nr:nitroreductase family protein [Desulfovibrio sp.]